MERPLTVLQVIPRVNAGGAELGCVQVAEALVRAGHRAIVASQGGRFVGQLLSVGAEHITLPVATKNPFLMWLNSRRLADIIRREKVDIVHARSRAPAWSALWASRETGIGFITTYHSAYSERNQLKSQYNRIMVKGDKVIAVSDYMAELIRSRYHTPDERIAVIHRCIDPKQFDIEALTPERLLAARQACGVGPRDRIVLLAGRIARRKVQDHLIEAAALLRRTGIEDFVCVMAGEAEKPEFLSELKAQAERLGISDKVRFPGHINDMPAVNRLATVALNISSFEGLPRAALEAQAMGVPVIVSDTGPGREVARTMPDVPATEVTGLRVPFHAPLELAEALRTMLMMPEYERRAMGERGRLFVRGRYTLDRMTAQTLAVYDEVASCPRRVVENVEIAAARRS